LSIRKRASVSDRIDEYFQEIEKWADQIRETLTEKPCWDLKTCAIEPLREITVKPTEVLVTVDLPYADKKTVKVEAADSSSLEISAEMKKKIRLTELGITHRQGVIQRFHAWIRIPVTVNMDKMKIEQKKGILEIRLPRKMLTHTRHKK
jgi:HSP20 family molecular chaperone IbpA